MAGYIPGGRMSPKKIEQDIAQIKFRFHRYLIERVDDDHFNILENTRQAIMDYVQIKLTVYVNDNALPLSRYEADRLAEELVDELVGFGPLESLLKVPRSQKSWSMAPSVFSTSVTGSFNAVICALWMTIMCRE